MAAMAQRYQKPTQRERFGELSEGLPGSTKSVASRRTHLPSTAHLPSRRTSGRCGGRCQGVLGRDDVCGEKRQELGRPDGFLDWAGTLGYPLSDQEQVGRLETISCREAEDPSGVGSAHSTLRR
jgi:hypothetical protein